MASEIQLFHLFSHYRGFGISWRISEKTRASQISVPGGYKENRLRLPRFLVYSLRVVLWRHPTIM